MAQPIVDDAVKDQVNAVSGAAISHKMRQIEIKIPTFAFAHYHAVSPQNKLHLGIGRHGKVQADLAVLETEFVIAVLFDRRTRFEPEQTN